MAKQHTQDPGYSHLLERQGGLVPVLAREVVVHAEVRLAAQLVPRGAVRDALDHPALGRKAGARLDSGTHSPRARGQC